MMTGLMKKGKTMSLQLFTNTLAIGNPRAQMLSSLKKGSV